VAAIRSRTDARNALLCALVAVLAGATAAVGVFGRGDGSSQIVTSAVGETYEMATTGLYAGNAQRVVAEGVGWDLFTLFVVAPLLLAIAPAVAGGSFRVRLFAIGLLAYFFYQYLMYAVTWAFGPLLLPFVAIYATSLLAIISIAAGLELGAGAARFADGFPRRRIAVLSIALAGMLVVMWLQRIVAGLQHGPAAGMLLGQTTMVVQALDLGLVVPLAVLAGVLTWRRRPIGYVLSLALVVKIVAMAAAICAMLLAAWSVEGTLETVPLAIFAMAAIAALRLGVKMYRCAPARL
jgi:hypothetical protein